MTDTTNPNDPLEFLRKMWVNMGVPVPGMVVPTLDVNELERKITDLKAVEGWLKMNLNMLQIHIQGLEMQCDTLAAMRTIGQGGNDPVATNNTLSSQAVWPWIVMRQAATAAAPVANISPTDLEKGD